LKVEEQVAGFGSIFGPSQGRFLAKIDPPIESNNQLARTLD
jgi:hypothetical protein